MTSQPALKIVWQSAAVWPVGYARYSSQLLHSLDTLGVEVAYRFAYHGSLVCGNFDEPQDTGDPVINRMRKNRADPDFPQVVCAGPDLFRRNFGRYRIGFATTEVNGIPRDWVEACNQMDEVWVLSAFNERAFRDSGVTRPLGVIPGGVDPMRFNLQVQGHSLKDHFLFLSVFEWSERKAPEILLRAFNREFKRSEKAVLLCKVMVPPWAPFDVPALVRGLQLSPAGGRIVLDLNTYLPASQLANLFRSADCFVLPSRGEGWGLPIFEAMACGLPVIVTQWGAPQDYLTEAIAYPIRVKKLAVAMGGKYPYSGYQWAEPDEEHFRTLMRQVYEHREEARQKGLKGSEFVRQELTWERAALKVVGRLQEVMNHGDLAGSSPHVLHQRVFRIGIDASRTIPPRERSGIGTYAQTLIEGLSRVDTTNQYVLYPGFGDFLHPEYGPACDLVVPRRDNFKKYSGPLPAFSHNHPRPLSRTQNERVDVVHSTAFACPEVSPAKLVVTVFDLTYRLFPEFHLPSNVAFCEAQMQAAMKRAVSFISISEQTKRDLLRCFAVDEARIRVIPLAVSSRFGAAIPKETVQDVLRKYRLSGNFIFSLSSLEPRKNIKTLLRAYAWLNSEEQANHSLVIAGCAGWLNSDVRSVMEDLKLGSHVKLLGYVDESDLPALYQAASLFVYPSFYEGFGLPVLEAMSCGAPVVISSSSSLPEVAGDAALYFDPHRVEEFAEQMTRLLSNETLQREYRQRSLSRSQHFSVERMAMQTLQVYEEAVSL